MTAYKYAVGTEVEYIGAAKNFRGTRGHITGLGGGGGRRGVYYSVAWANGTQTSAAQGALRPVQSIPQAQLDLSALEMSLGQLLNLHR